MNPEHCLCAHASSERRIPMLLHLVIGLRKLLFLKEFIKHQRQVIVYNLRFLFLPAMVFFFAYVFPSFSSDRHALALVVC